MQCDRLLKSMLERWGPVVKSNLSYSRNILAMEDKELEVFVHRWVARQIKKYPDHHLFGNANDLGRDAVGFRTLNRHDGDWDNYQCKMLSKRVNDAMMHEELAKILFHASEGEFTPPAAYFFVAPKGFNRKAEKLLFSPSLFKQQMLGEWDARCASRIRTGPPVVLTDKAENILGFGVLEKTGMLKANDNDCLRPTSILGHADVIVIVARS